MKRIEFIAPVEAMRGNLSGAQSLEYAENNNPAYDAPVGKMNYARNYMSRFIGAKRASDGLKYFAVRTKSAVNLTAKAKHAMALLGGTGAIVGAILHDKSSAVYTGIYDQWVALNALGNKKSLRKYMSDVIREMLASKAVSTTFAGPKTPVEVKNPWTCTDIPTVGAMPSKDIIRKFLTELGPNGVFEYEASIEGDGIAHLFAVEGKTVAETYATATGAYSVCACGYDDSMNQVTLTVSNGSVLVARIGQDLSTRNVQILEDENWENVQGTDEIDVEETYRIAAGA